MLPNVPRRTGAGCPRSGIPSDLPKGDLVRRTAFIGLLTLALLVPACKGSDGSTPEISGTDRPPDNATVVVGNLVCSGLPPESPSESDTASALTERFQCHDETSDPRVGGTETITLVTRIAGSSIARTWVSETAELTNDGGTWHGTGQGLVDLVGVLPQAQGVKPFKYGEMHYVGEGAYEGLEYHYYFAGSDSRVGVTGWIASTG